MMDIRIGETIEERAQTLVYRDETATLPALLDAERTSLIAASNEPRNAISARMHTSAQVFKAARVYRRRKVCTSANAFLDERSLLNEEIDELTRRLDAFKRERNELDAIWCNRHHWTR